MRLKTQYTGDATRRPRIPVNMTVDLCTLHLVRSALDNAYYAPADATQAAEFWSRGEREKALRIKCESRDPQVRELAQAILGKISA